MGVVLFGSAAPIVFRVGIVIGFRTSGCSDSLIIKMLSCRSFLKVLLGSFRLYHMIVIVFLTRADVENKHGIHLPKATAYSMLYCGLAFSFLLLLCLDSHVIRTILLFPVVHRFACASSSGLPESCGWLPRKETSSTYRVAQ